MLLSLNHEISDFTNKNTQNMFSLTHQKSDYSSMCKSNCWFLDVSKQICLLCVYFVFTFCLLFVYLLSVPSCGIVPFYENHFFWHRIKNLRKNLHNWRVGSALRDAFCVELWLNKGIKKRKRNTGNLNSYSSILVGSRRIWWSWIVFGWLYFRRFDMRAQMQWHGMHAVCIMHAARQKRRI